MKIKLLIVVVFLIWFFRDKAKKTFCHVLGCWIDAKPDSLRYQDRQSATEPDNPKDIQL